MTTSRLDLVKRYLAALEAFAVGDELARFFTDDVVQEEFPNRLVPQGARRDLAGLLEGAARGKQVMQRQRFELISATEGPSTMALEMIWTGTLSVPLGTLRPGDQMRARIGAFIEFEGDRIRRQRNYDCYDAW